VNGETAGTAFPASSSLEASRSQRISFWRSDPLLILLLILGSSLPYLNSLANGFVYDDDTQILTNPYIRDFSHLKAIFTTSVWSYAGGARAVTNYYRPVMTMGYLLCYKVFGFRAWGFHLVSLALNAAVVCLLFVVARRIFQDRGLAFAAAALFALHPMHTEAVDWIAAVTDLELALFFLLSFWLYLRLEDAKGIRLVWTHLGVACAYLLALLSKEPAAVLPLLAVIWEHALRADRSRTSWSTKLQRYAPLWLLLIAYLLFRTALLGAFAPVSLRSGMAPDAVIFSAVALTGGYLAKMLWPVQLCAYYVFPRNMANLLPKVIGGCMALLLCGALTVYLWNRERRLSFGLIWFFATLAPVLNARWMPNNVLAERYLYLPSVGLCWVAAWLACRLWRAATKAGKIAERTVAACAFLLAALLAARIFTRNPDWKDDLTFYTKALAASPNAADMHNNLGNYYWERGDLNGAATQWEQAVKLQPDATYTLDNLGLLRINQNRFAEAVVFFRRSLAITPHDAAAYTGLGEAYQKMNMLSQAEQALLEAIRLAPLDIRPQLHLAELYFSEGKFDLAAQRYQASIRALPSLRGYFGLGLAEWARNDTAKAEQAFKMARAFNPGAARPYFMLGLLYGASGRTAQAIQEYQAGLKIDPKNKIALNALAKLSKQAPGAERY